MDISIARVNKRFSCGVAIFFILIICFSSYLILRKNRENTNPRSVALLFAVSLINNDQNEALSLATAEKHTEIKNWMQEHKTVSCPFSLESLGDDRFYISLTHDIETVKHFNYVSSNACPGWYRFTIQNIVVERQDEGWIVVDWGEIKESLD